MQFPRIQSSPKRCHLRHLCHSPMNARVLACHKMSSDDRNCHGCCRGKGSVANPATKINHKTIFRFGHRTTYHYHHFHHPTPASPREANPTAIVTTSRINKTRVSTRASVNKQHNNNTISSSPPSNPPAYHEAPASSPLAQP